MTLAEERAAREEAEGAAERLRSELDGLRAAQARLCCFSCDGAMCGPVHYTLAKMLVSSFPWLSLKAAEVTDRGHVAFCAQETGQRSAQERLVQLQQQLERLSSRAVRCSCRLH